MRVRRVDFYPDDWLTGTIGLDDAERGVYITICALIYARGGPISFELLKASTLSHGLMLNRCVRRLKELGKITENGGRIGQERCEKELRRRGETVEKARRNGSKGGRPNGLGKADGSESEKAYILQSTVSNQQEEDSEAKASAVAEAPAAPEIDPLKVFWTKAVDHLVVAQIPDKQARAVIGKWKAEFGMAAVMAAIAASEAELAAEPIAFISACLNQSRKAANGHGKLTEANKRFIAGRQATLRAVLDREREADTGDWTADSG